MAFETAQRTVAASRARRWPLSLVLASLALGAPAVEAATVPAGFTETLVASGLASPTAMAFAPDGRLFVCQQGGQLRVIKNGVLLQQPFLTVTVSSVGERGLLGVAFDPDFASNGFVYVYYTATTPTIHNRVSRFTAAGDVAAAGSEVVLLDLNTLSSATNHNGGAMHFGPDGRLFVAVGDNANGSNAQTLANLLGKMLRINRDGTIPADNPFFAQATGQNRAIWAMGLRNPFTFTFHEISGRMFINDVGQNSWEEVNDGLAGANYGWPTTEGPTTNPAFVSPVYAYGHGGGAFTGCAITGGAFYAGTPAPYPGEYVNDYFFADYCSGWINRLDLSSGVAASPFASGIAAPVDLTIGPEGSLYYLARGSGSSTGVVYRVDYTASEAPVITRQPTSQTVSIGQTATFVVEASGTAPLFFQWTRNGTDIAGATGASYTTPPAAIADSGSQFSARVSNSAGSVTSNAAALTVVANAPPTATILSPADGMLYTAGTAISYSGGASDPEDGPLGASRFTWEIVFHHDTHTHPFIGPVSGATSGSFTIPNTGETSANVFYRIHLRVTDSTGQQASAFRDVRPRTVQITLASSPNGLTLTLDGQPVVAPYVFTGVVGMLRTIGAPSQTLNGATYEFRSWSDRGAQTHTIVTPAGNTTLKASYRKFRPPRARSRSGER
jgi:glucose/arabinose dehydrogenase